MPLNNQDLDSITTIVTTVVTDVVTDVVTSAVTSVVTASERRTRGEIRQAVAHLEARIDHQAIVTEDGFLHTQDLIKKHLRVAG